MGLRPSARRRMDAQTLAVPFNVRTDLLERSAIVPDRHAADRRAARRAPAPAAAQLEPWSIEPT